MTLSSPDPDAAAVAFDLVVHPEEARVAGTALRLLIDDGAHQGVERTAARRVLAALPEPGGDAVTIPLTDVELKVTWLALRIYRDDLTRREHDIRVLAQAILDRLPDEHA